MTTYDQITANLTPAQAAAIQTMDAGTDFKRWFRANSQTGIRVATGNALVEKGLAEATGFMRATRGEDSAYRLTTRGRLIARRLTR